MKLYYIKNGETLGYDPDRCIGCLDCIDVCPHDVFEADATIGKIRIRDRRACMECGACARNCPTGALTVQPGVGCVAAIVAGKLRGTAPSCDCGTGTKGCC